MPGHRALLPRPRSYDVATRAALLGHERATRRRIAALADLRPGDRCLDVGAGHGALTRALVEAGGATAAVDATIEMAASAARSAPAVVAIAQQLPFADSCCDVVTCCLTLHHLSVDGRAAFLSEARRVLRPAGRLLLVDLVGRAAALESLADLGFSVAAAGRVAVAFWWARAITT